MGPLMFVEQTGLGSTFGFFWLVLSWKWKQKLIIIIIRKLAVTDDVLIVPG